MNRLKKGVSLVTVLLFMMVATIAATATYKWLSSVGSSSAARLELSEARLAAKAGVDAARSWMTFNGNDVGALIKQYFENSKKPIFLNPVLPRLTSSKMRDSVWLVGVNVEKSNYKLKVLSVGMTRDNTKYSEMAVFDVSGLYQVRLPSQTPPLNYEESFNGGLATAGVINVDRAIIKQTPAVKNAGGQGLNNVTVADYLILDGNFYVNNQGNVGDLYVTGDLAFGNNLNVGGNLYVGGPLYGTSSGNQLTVRGSAFLAGGMHPNERPPYIVNDVHGFESPIGGTFVFRRNVTSGTIDHFRCTAPNENQRGSILIDGNLVLNGRLVFPNGFVEGCDNVSSSIRVMGNAFVSENSTQQGQVDFQHIRRTFFGSEPSHRIFVNGFSTLGVPTDICGDNGAYKCAKAGNSNENMIHFAYVGNLTASITDDERVAWGADNLQNYGNKIATRNPNADVAQDPIQFNTALLNSRFVHSASNPRGCSEDIWKSDVDNPVELLNACYSEAAQNDNLYDDSWLIVEFASAPEWSSPVRGQLTHNFIFVVNSPSPPTREWELPETSNDGQVFLYLPNGWPNTGTDKGIVTSKIEPNPRYNYFIYSDGNIGHFNTKIANPISLQGSIFLSGTSQLNSAHGDNDLAIRFNQTLVENLATSHILCNYDGSRICAAYAGVAGGVDDAPVLNRSVDSYHIATAPQLTVSVESQYNSRENISRDPSDFDMIQKTAVVLPRIVYLSRDPVGRLRDYYNVVALNGSKQTRDAAKMTCPAQIRTGGQMLYSEGNLIEEGVYVCSYTEDEHKTNIPMYVVVHGLLNEQVDVHFDRANRGVVAGFSADVVLDARQTNHPITVHIAVPLASEIPNGWAYQPSHTSGTLTHIRQDAHNDIYSYTYTPDNDGAKVFTVTTDPLAAPGAMSFQLADDFCDNCIIGQPDVTQITIANRVQVDRYDFGSEFCGNEARAAQFKSNYMLECSDVVSWPSCEPIMKKDLEWVNIKGCVNVDPNKSWNCLTDGQKVSLTSTLAGEPLCQVFIPDSSLTLADPRGNYILPGVIKRKQIDVRVEFKGDRGSTRAWVVYDRPKVGYDGASVRDSSVCDNDEVCTFKLFAGDQVTVRREKSGSAIYNYLVCKGDDCFKRDTTIASDSIRFTLGGTSADTVEFHFGEKDRHCFYTDFDTTKVWCTNDKQTDCIDYCANGSDHCTIDDGHYKNADWVMVYANKSGWHSSSYVKPTVSGRSLYVLGSNEPTTILNTAAAGYNGKYTAMFEVPVISSNLWDQLEGHAYEDGFIIRSDKNANNYFFFSVVAVADIAYGFLSYYENGSRKIGPQKVGFKRGLNESQPTPLPRSILNDKFNASVNIYLHENTLTATLHYNFGKADYGQAVAQFDMSERFGSYLCSTSNETCRQNRQYVGVKFNYEGFASTILNLIGGIIGWLTGSDSEPISNFVVHDIGWASETYADSCWNTPSVTCSFRANYAGGMVPKDSLVTPWVGMSSWFDGKECEVSYFYNGCDLREDMFLEGWNLFGFSMTYGNNNLACRLTKDKGFYRLSAQKLDLYKRGKLKDENYWFKEEGYHGYPYAPNDKQLGYINEASVLVYCTGDGANGHTYPASCGDFIVGTYEQCSESYGDLLYDAQAYCFADTCRPDLAIDSVINVRDAVIKIEVANLYNGSVDVYLMDADSNYSAKARTVTEPGEYSIEVSKYSENGGFNPQRVIAVAFVPHDVSNYTITHIASSCPYAFGLRCMDATYNSQLGVWHVAADVVHPERAKNCAVVGHGAAEGISTLGPQPCSGFMQEIEQKNVYGQLDEREYYFSVLAYDDHDQVMDSCVTQKTSIQPLEITCSLGDGTMDAREVERGGGIPSFSFTLSGCPEEGCSYTIIYPDGSQEGGIGTSGSELCPGNDCSKYNTPDDKWDEGDDYSYNIDVYDNHCLGGNIFSVTPEPPDANCSAKIEDGVFVANVFFDGGANPSSWKGNYQVGGTGTFAFTDPMGVVLETEKVKMSERTFTRALPQEAQTCAAGNCHYYAILKLHGDESDGSEHHCTVEWDVRAAMTDARCPANIQNQDPTKDMVVLPNMGGCEEGDCSWEISRGFTVVKTGSGYNGKDTIKFSDGAVAGPRSYQLKVTNPANQTKTCTFNVTFNNSALSASCSFGSDQFWGEEGKLTIDGNCEGCSYTVRSPSNHEVKTGTTNSYPLVTEAIFRLNEPGTYSVYVNGASTPTCIAETSLPELGKLECSFPLALSTNGQGTLSATIAECQNGNCSWPFVLKKNGNPVATPENVTGNEVQIDITGPGSYALYLNGQSTPACEGTVLPKNDCYIDNKKSEYTYGETFTFVVEDLTAKKNRGCNYQGNNCSYWQYTFGTSGSAQTYKVYQSYNNQRLTIDVSAKTSGTYTFEGGNKQASECSDGLVVEHPTLTCKQVGKMLYVTATGCAERCTATYQNVDYPSYTGSIEIINGSGSVEKFSQYRYQVYFSGDTQKEMCEKVSPKLISCIKKNWDRSDRYLEITAENCEAGCTLNLYRWDNRYSFTKQVFNSKKITDLNGQNYDVWFDGGERLTCSF